MPLFRRTASLAFAALVAASAAGAATLHEADMQGGAFGASWDRPTVVAAGYDLIEGTGTQNRYDTFAFALPKGAQRLTIDFAAPAGIGDSYSAGGAVLFSEAPFRHGWDGRQAATLQLDKRNPTGQVAIDLAKGFGGALYLALNFTHGDRIAYTISAPSNAIAPSPAPAPVPVPAGLGLILAGAAALAGARALGRRRAAV